MEKLTRYGFEQEMLKIPAKCRRLSSKTSKQKVKDIFDKYEDLIAYNKDCADRPHKEVVRLRNICNALKSGTIKYDCGFCMVSEILRVDVRKENVVVYFKNGTEQSFVKEFEWMIDLF